MPVAALDEGIIHICGRWLGRLLVEFLFETVCYAVGFVVLRVITFGAHPSADEAFQMAFFPSLVS